MAKVRNIGNVSASRNQDKEIAEALSKLIYDPLGYVYFALLTVGIIFSFIYPLLSISIYGLIVAVFVLFSALGKTEYVVSAGFASKKDKI